MKKYLRFLPVVTFVGVSLLFLFLTPGKIVAYIGIENAYVLIFVLAFLGGLTTFSGIPYHLVLIGFAAGGLNPWILGPLTAIAVSLGDCTSYLIGYFGREIIPVRLQNAMQRLSRIQEAHPRLLPSVFFLYGALVPFSNDVITIPMGFLKYPILRVMIPLAIGTTIFNTGLALVAVYAYDWIPFVQLNN